MAKILGIAAAVIIFLIWMGLVGNPHVIETVIGVVIAAIAGFWVYSKARRFRS
jgi:putative flippase GtrA